MSLLKRIGRNFSSFLAKRPQLLFRIQESWLAIGYNLFDLKMADWVIRRPEWLRKKPSRLSRNLEPSIAHQQELNIELAKRTINAYQAVEPTREGNLIPTQSIWGELRQSHYAKLRALVEAGEAPPLAEFQRNIFRTETVNGYTYGTTFDGWPHRWHYLPIQIELSVVQLAESIGVLRAECHEQGEIAFWRSIFSEEALISEIETFFGFRVEQPRQGDPRGIIFGGRFLTRETCSHLHSAFRMWKAIKRDGRAGIQNIIEIGGGFGGTCYWLRKLLGSNLGRYAIVDLPEVSLVQCFFLGSLAPNALVLRGEHRSDYAGAIELIPHFLLDQIEFRPTVLINQDSMPEMPKSEVERYLSWANENLDGLFLSFNQETYSPAHGSMQVHVAEVARSFPRLRLVSRDTSWDRRGYVEEVYTSIN